MQEPKKEYLSSIRRNLTQNILAVIEKKPDIETIKDFLDESEAILNEYRSADQQQRRLLTNYCLGIDYGIKIANESKLLSFWNMLVKVCGSTNSHNIFVTIINEQYPARGLDEMIPPSPDDYLKKTIHALEILIHLPVQNGFGFNSKQLVWNFVNKQIDSVLHIAGKTKTFEQALKEVFEPTYASMFYPKTNPNPKVSPTKKTEKTNFFKPAAHNINYDNIGISADTIFHCFEPNQGEPPDLKDMLVAISKRNQLKIETAPPGCYGKNSTNKYGANLLQFAVYYDCVPLVDKIMSPGNLDPEGKISIMGKAYNALELAIFLGKTGETIALLVEMFPQEYGSAIRCGR